MPHESMIDVEAIAAATTDNHFKLFSSVRRSGKSGV
jgi:hypothetical protein